MSHPKIDAAMTSPLSGRVPVAADRINARVAGAGGAPAPVAAAEPVKLSGEARQLGAMREQMQAAPDESSVRIQELRALVASGQYQPDSHKTALNLARFEWQLYG